MTNDITEMSCKEALLAIAEGFELFHSPNQKAYATTTVNGGLQTCAIKSQSFRGALQSIYYHHTKKSPNSQAFKEAVETLEATAIYGGKKQPVYYRIAEINGCIYVDLGTDTHEVVKITTEGWEVIQQTGIKFIRTNTMKPMSIPIKGGDIHKLHDFINVSCLLDLRIVVAWILSTYRQTGSYPILIAQGQQGTGKSSLCRVLLELTDPREAALRSMPKKEHDLLVTASKNHVIAFDNLSGLSNDLSDALCRVSTGGGLSGRKLYTDDDEFVLDVKKPIIVNGIDDIACRADLASRSIVINLPVIDAAHRKDESSMNKEFDKQKPYLLGAIFDAIAEGLKNIDSVELDQKPRMADFAKWSSAMEQHLGWGVGGFMSAYNQNIQSSIEAGIAGNSAVQAIIAMMNIRERFDDTAANLLSHIQQYAPEGCDTRYDYTWPKNPRMLSQMLQRSAPQLRHIGINVNTDHRTNKGRIVILEKVD